MAFLTDKSLDYAAKNLVEGCIFVNIPLSRLKSCNINGQPAHLCSESLNPGYNRGQKIIVTLINNEDGSESDENIQVCCYDSPKSDNRLTLMKVSAGENEYFDFIDSAHVVVYHNNGDPDSIEIECVRVKHRLDTTQVSIPVETFACDYRSFNSKKYCLHKDVNVHTDSNEIV